MNKVSKIIKAEGAYHYIFHAECDGKQAVSDLRYLRVDVVIEIGDPEFSDTGPIRASCMSHEKENIEQAHKWLINRGWEFDSKWLE